MADYFDDGDIKDLISFVDSTSYIQDLIKLINNNLYNSNNGNFNIFSFISEKYYREDFHSNILSLILSPHHPPIGSKENLKIFLENIGVDKSFFHNKFWTDNKVIIEREKFVKLGRIDILVTFESENKKKVVIIENKINGAHDQEKQLQRYIQSFNENEILKLVYIPNFTVSVDELVKQHELEDYKDKIVVLSTVATTESGPALQKFLEDVCRSKGKEDAIISNKFISDYLELLNLNYSKGPIMDNIQKIIEDNNKKEEFCKFAAKADKILSCWNRRADYIFNYITANQEFRRLEFKKSNIYGAPCIWWKNKADNFGVYIQGEHQSYIQIGFYFSKFDEVNQDDIRKIIGECTQPYFGELTVYRSGSHWMFCNITNELLDKFNSFSDIEKNINEVLSKLISS